MLTKLNKNDNHGKIELDKKETFKVQKNTHFIYKIYFWKEYQIQFSRMLENYLPKICQNFQKVDDQGAKGNSFF